MEGPLPDQDDVLAFMGAPEAYDTAPARIERIETHASVVFLAGNRAYKVKRAVKFPFAGVGVRREHHTHAQRREGPANGVDALRIVIDEENGLRHGTTSTGVEILDRGVGNVRWLRSRVKAQVRNRLRSRPPYTQPTMILRTRIVGALVLAALIPMAVVLAVPLVQAEKRASDQTARRLDDARRQAESLIERERAGLSSAADHAAKALAADRDDVAAVLRGPESEARPVAERLASRFGLDGVAVLGASGTTLAALEPGAAAAGDAVLSERRPVTAGGETLTLVATRTLPTAPTCPEPRVLVAVSPTSSLCVSVAAADARDVRRDLLKSFAGVAPEAGLVIQAFEADAQGAIIGLDPDYYKLFDQAYADGARLHTNSWGDTTSAVPGPAQYGGYPSGSRDADRFMWEHPAMAIFFAAGNSGRDGVPNPANFCVGGDGVVDSDSLLAPATAKNVITVGGAESQRASGGYSGLPWFYFDTFSFCFATAPIRDDLPSDNVEGMAAFSSRGPTDDGRVKPDLVAPGVNIVSNRSHALNAGTLWGVHETNPNYAYSGGTSMATPLVAGAGALVRQWLIARGIANPSAAVVKATLLDTTHDMRPGQYGTGTAREIPALRPNNVEGWGGVDLSFMNAPAPYAIWVDDHTSGLATGQSAMCPVRAKIIPTAAVSGPLTKRAIPTSK
jgi:hypothetical protein